MDKEKARNIMTESRGVLTALFARHGMVFDMGRVSYDSQSGDIRFQVKATESNPSDQFALQKKEWESRCQSYGLAKDDFKRTFTYGHSTYQICGIRPKATKNPILALNTATGKRYGFATMIVKHALEKEKRI